MISIISFFFSLVVFFRLLIQSHARWIAAAQQISQIQWRKKKSNKFHECTIFLVDGLFSVEDKFFFRLLRLY